MKIGVAKKTIWKMLLVKMKNRCFVLCFESKLILSFDFWFFRISNKLAIYLIGFLFWLCRDLFLLSIQKHADLIWKNFIHLAPFPILMCPFIKVTIYSLQKIPLYVIDVHNYGANCKSIMSCPIYCFFYYMQICKLKRNWYMAPSNTMLIWCQSMQAN